MVGWVLEHLPHSQCYVEPFAGSAAVLFAKPPSKVEVLNDLDGGVRAFFTALRDHRDELAQKCKLTPYSRQEFAAARQASDDITIDVVEQARRFFVIVTQGFGSVPATTGWSSPDPNHGEAVKVERLIDRFEQCADRLRHVHLESLDALEIIRRYDSPKTTFFVDPPYLWSTRSWAARQTFKQDYRAEFQTDDEHRLLLKTLNEVDAAVVLAGRANPIYDDMLTGWKRIDGPRNEVLWIKPG